MAQSELEKNQSSSSEEEEESSEGSESESESEKTPPPPPLSEKTQSSSEESESDADSTVKNSDIVDPNIKPLTSIPMNDESLKPTPSKPVTGKRKTAEVENEARELKIAKKKEVVAVENAGEKKPLFQRLWSEDDEIELIKGMISYLEKKGKDPIADVADFHEFVKNSLSIDVNIGQMNAKVRRLKAKFMNNAGKIEQKGKVRSLSNPHEKKMYELSEKLWSSNRNSNKNKKAVVISCSTKKVDANSKTNQRQTNNKSTNSGEAKVKLAIAFPITDEYFMQKGLESLSGPKKAELEEKWNNLKMLELKHFVKKLDVVQEQTEKILYVIEKSDAS